MKLYTLCLCFGCSMAARAEITSGKLGERGVKLQTDRRRLARIAAAPSGCRIFSSDRGCMMISTHPTVSHNHKHSGDKVPTRQVMARDDNKTISSTSPILCLWHELVPYRCLYVILLRISRTDSGTRALLQYAVGSTPG